MNYIDFYGCMYACPYGSRLKSCPVYKLSNESFADKFNWFEDLFATEKELFVEQHKQCSRKRAEENYFYSKL